MQKTVYKACTYSLLVIFLVSCGPSPSIVQNALEQTRFFEASIQTAIAETHSVKVYEISQTPSPSTQIKLTSTITPSPSVEPSPTIRPTEKAINIKLNEPASITGFCDFFITDIVMAKEILPPNTSGYYRYYEAKGPDSILLDVVLTIINRGTTIKSAEDFVKVSVVYDDKFTYTSKAVLLDSDGDFTSGFYGIEPLISGEVHHIINLPIETKHSSKSLVVLFKIMDFEYKHVIR